MRDGILRRAVTGYLARRRARPDVLDQSFIIRQLRRFWNLRLTPAGRSLFAAGLLLGHMTVVISPIPRAPWLFGILATTAVACLFCGLAFRPRLKVSRRLPEAVTAGREFVAPVEVENLSRRHARDIEVRQFLPPRLTVLGGNTAALVPGGERRELPVRMRAARRGVYTLEKAALLSSFPFGLWNGIRETALPGRLTVYPDFTPLEGLDLPVGLTYQPGGVALTSNLGESTEFLTIREYTPGDNPRHIHAPSWARIGAPVVKEFQEEYFCRIAVVLDTFVPWAAGARGEDAMEAAVSVAAAVADALARREYIVDLFAAGPELYFLEAGRSLAYLANILEILSCVDPCRSSPFAVLGPAVSEHLAQTTTVVLVLLDWDEEREAFVRFCREAGAAVKVVVVRDGETTRGAPPDVPVFSAADARGVVKL